MRLYSVLAVMFVCLSLAEASTEKNPLVNKALDAYESGNYEHALSILEEEIKDTEWQLQFLYRLRGDNYFQLNQFEKARDNYLKALPRPGKGAVAYRLGKTYDELGKFKKAVDYLDKSIQQSEDNSLQNALARYYKGRALSALGKFKEARIELLKISSTETTKDIMVDVQVMIDFCTEQEKAQQVSSPRGAEAGSNSEEINP